MQLVKVYRNGYYSIQFFQGKNFYFGDDHRWHEKLRQMKELRAKQGKQKFKITKQIQNRFVSRSLRLFDDSIHSPSTQILTYPLYYNESNIRIDSTYIKPYEDLNRYLSNLRKNYNLNAYMSALELTKANQWHFHLIVDMPYTKTDELKSAWLNAIGLDDVDFIVKSNNSVRDVRKIRKEVGVAVYCGHYLGKAASKSHYLKKFTNSTKLNGNENVYIDRGFLSDYKEVKPPKRHDYCLTGTLVLDNRLKVLFK